LHRTRQYRDVLKQAVRDLIALSEERIRLGETNVKSHMFLSMILAQAEAVEAGGDVEVRVTRAARDSLEWCDNLLATREDTGSSRMASPDEAGLVAAGMEGFGPDFGWDSFFPDGGLGFGCMGCIVLGLGFATHYSCMRKSSISSAAAKLEIWYFSSGMVHELCRQLGYTSHMDHIGTVIRT
jgi:hypothetical protein